MHIGSIHVFEGPPPPHHQVADAIGAKLHLVPRHCLVDGVAGTELLAAIMDVSPDPAPALAEEWRPERQPSGPELVIGVVRDLTSGPVEPLRTLRSATRAPRELAASVLEVAFGSLALAGVFRRAPDVSICGPIGPHRRYAWAAASVDDVKGVRKALGGTFNDTVLAAITAG